MFDFLKNKKDETNHQPTSIEEVQVGDVIDYYMKSWETQEEGVYDWGNNESSKEFKLNSGDEVLYLSIYEDDELEISVFSKITWSAIDGDLRSTINQYNEPPRELVKDGVKYYLTDNGMARYRSLTKDKGWSNFAYWDYEDESEDKIVSIESWDGDFEISAGEYVEPFEFSIFRKAKEA